MRNRALLFAAGFSLIAGSTLAGGHATLEFQSNEHGVRSLAPAGMFEIEDYSFDIEQTLNIGSQSSGAGAGKVTFNPFNITRKIDAASPQLFRMCATGAHFKTVVLHVRKAGGEQEAVELHDVGLSNYQKLANGEETFTLTPAYAIVHPVLVNGIPVERAAPRPTAGY